MPTSLSAPTSASFKVSSPAAILSVSGGDETQLDVSWTTLTGETGQRTFTGGVATFGPWTVGTVVTIQGRTGSISYDVLDNSPLTSTQTEQVATASAAGLLTRRGAAAIPALTSWWPLTEGSGATVSDALNPSLTGTFQGTLGGQWANGASEGVVFNGTDNQIAVNPSPVSNLLRQILNLSTLVDGEQLLIWFVVTHPTTIAAAGILTWGLEGTAGANAAYEGFSIALLNTNSWLQWRDRPPGASTFTQTGLTNPVSAPTLQGNVGSNTKSAVCLAIEANTALGFYEITASRACITTQGNIGQTDNGFYTVPFLPNGASGRTRYNAAAGLTLGAIAKTGQVNTGDYAVRTPASHALRNVGFQRRPAAYGGIAQRIARDLAKAPTAFPASARLV